MTKKSKQLIVNHVIQKVIDEKGIKESQVTARIAALYPKHPMGYEAFYDIRTYARNPTIHELHQISRAIGVDKKELSTQDMERIDENETKPLN